MVASKSAASSALLVVCGEGIFPRFLLRPKSTGGVAAAVRVARRHALEVSVRSGGHGFLCQHLKNDSLHLDLRELDKVDFVVPENANAVSAVIEIMLLGCSFERFF